MNTLSLKKIVTAVFLSAVISGSALAATPAASPKDASAKIQQPAPLYPGALWSYAVPPLNANTMPTIDKNGQQFLPYLPWIGQNLSLLVNYADFFYQLQQADINGSTGPYNSVGTATANNIVSQTRDQNMQAASGKTATGVAAQLTFSSTPSSSNSTPSASKLAELPGTDSSLPCTGTGCSAAPTNEQFNADTLFGSMGYPTGLANSINDLIFFLASLTQPLPDPGLSSDQTKRQTQLQRADVQSYLLMARTMVSLQSMALSNFNFLAQERAIIPDLGTKANMQQPAKTPGGSPTPIKDASQLQLEQYLVDNRLSNPDWYATMNTASPAAVQREMLFILAETQRQLFELRMVNERMLATMSTMQMAMTQMGRSNIQVTANQVKDSLNQASSTPSG